MQAPESRCYLCDEPVLWATPLTDGRFLCEACRIVLFFETELTLTGDYSGQPFILVPEVKRILRDVFGTLDPETGLRQYRDVYIEMPTSNAKTTIGAGLCLYFLATTITQGTEVYSAAAARQQAGQTYQFAHQMVENNARLRAMLKLVPSTKRIMRRDDPTSFYAALSADGSVNDGIVPAFVLRDELHRWHTKRQLALNSVLESKLKKRKNPLLWDITTAGEQDESPLCWDRHEYARRISEGSDRDPRFYGRIFAADSKRIESEPDYWKSREAAVQANPSHEDNGGFQKHSDYEDQITKATNDPKKRADYLRFVLNYWGQTDEAAIDAVKWHACGGPVDFSGPHTRFDLDRILSELRLANRTAYAGVDASWTVDLTAVAFVFPPQPVACPECGHLTACQHRPDSANIETTPWVLLPFFWMPQEKVDERERKDRQPYKDWADRGFLTLIPGGHIDLLHIKERILWGSRTFDLREVCYDKWNFLNAAQDLEREGVPCTEVPQNFSHLSAPTKHLLELYPDGRLIHGNHPVLNFNARSLRLQGDRKDNVQPTKPKRDENSKRIDGLSAAITAMHRAMLAEPTQMNLVEVW